MGTKRGLFIGDDLTSKGTLISDDGLSINKNSQEIVVATILDEGTASERFILGMQNNQWLSAPAYDETGQNQYGYVNIIKLDESNEILFGAPVKVLENIILPDDPGENLPVVDCVVTSDSAVGEEHSYAFRLNYLPLLQIGGTADGAGGLSDTCVKVRGTLFSTNNDPIVLQSGNSNNTGDWRFYNDAGTMKVQKYDGEVWVDISEFTIPDTAPKAINVRITNAAGTITNGTTAYSAYDFYDLNEDAEGTSTYQWYSADDDQGTNEAAISGATSVNYTTLAGDVGKFIRIGVTPVSATGTTTTGTEAFSEYREIV